VHVNYRKSIRILFDEKFQLLQHFYYEILSNYFHDHYLCKLKHDICIYLDVVGSLKVFQYFSRVCVCVWFNDYRVI